MNIFLHIPKKIRQQVAATLRLAGAMSVICIMLGTQVAHAALSEAQLNALGTGALYFNTEYCTADGIVSTGSAGSGAVAPVIVLDPGHIGTSATPPQTRTDSTGLIDYDYYVANENDEVFKIAKDVEAKLVAAGYTVKLTKNSASETPTLRERANIANTANANLAVSIHDDHGEDWNSFGEVYVQRMDSHRDLTDSSGKITKQITFPSLFDSSAQAQSVADKSSAMGQTFADQRSAVEGHTVSVKVNHTFDSRPGFSPGNLPLVQLFSKVPWIYNEVGAAPVGQNLSDAHVKLYEQGLINSIMTAVPVTNGTTATSTVSTDPPTGTTAPTPPTTTPAAGTSSLIMQPVPGIGEFKPATQAVDYYNGTALPKIQKFLPLYTKAATLEGIPQNWEILAGLHAAETNYGNSYTGSGFYIGPFQEDRRQLAAYLSDPEYSAALSTLVSPGGTIKSTPTLNDDQFVVLARLALKHWIKAAVDYSILQKGPIAYNPSEGSDNIFWKIMHIWNGGAERYESFNGYTQADWGLITEFGTPFDLPGAATTYYMIKQSEASGKLGTISAVGGGDAAVNACLTNAETAESNGSGSPNCMDAKGTTKILCEAKKYDPASYEESARGNHLSGGNTAWLKTCPVINPSCYLDCSGLVSIAVYDAFGNDSNWVTQTIVTDHTNWKEISTNSIQPGDIIEPNAGHVEIVDHVVGNQIYTFGAHTSKYPQPRQVGPSLYSKSGVWKSFQYIGKGV